jgi:hypothetical protein
MNYNIPSDFCIRGSEAIALGYLNNIPRDIWIRFDSIPNGISCFVINMLDSGYKPDIKVVFDELHKRFLLTKEENHLGLALTLKREL